MADNSQKNFEDELQARLLNPAKRFKLWQQMNSVPGNLATPCGTFPGAVAPHLTPSGTAQGGGSAPLLHPSGMTPPSFQGVPMWWPPFLPPFFTHLPGTLPASQPAATQESTSIIILGCSQANDNAKDSHPVISHEGDDIEDDLALNNPEQDSLFDLSIKTPGTWDPPSQMSGETF